MSTHSGRILACALLVLTLPHGTSADTERISRAIPFAPGGTVRLKNFSGDVRISGVDRSEVTINATRRAPRERLDRIKLDIRASGSTIAVEANKKEWISWFGYNNVVETDFEIDVPKRTSLEISVFSSPVTVTGVTGSHNFHSFSSTLRLRDITGPIKAKTFSGDIVIELAVGVDRPDLELDSFSGDIDLRLPAGAKANVNFSSFSGDLTSDLPLLLHSKSRRRLTAELNGSESGGGASRSSNDLRLKTFSGNVHIRR